MTTTARVIRCICDQLGADPEQIQVEHRLIEDLGADSLDNVELAMELEAEFDIRIDDDQFIQLKTVQQVIDHVHELMGVPA